MSDVNEQGVMSMMAFYENKINDLKFSLELARQRENSLKEALEGPKQDRRRRIFEQVALNDISQNERYWANQAERVIKAADEFAEKEIEK